MVKFERLVKGLKLIEKHGVIDSCGLDNVPKVFLLIELIEKLEPEHEQTLEDLKWERQDDGYIWVFRD